MAQDTDWMTHHWKEFVQWCEGEFIARTILNKQGQAPKSWDRVARRLTVTEVLGKARGLRCPLSAYDLCSRYHRRRNWALWMALHDRKDIQALRQHGSFKARAVLRDQRAQG